MDFAGTSSSNGIGQRIYKGLFHRDLCSSLLLYSLLLLAILLFLMSKTSWLISEMIFSNSQGLNTNGGGQSSRTVDSQWKTMVAENPAGLWIDNEKSWWWRIQSKIKLRICVDEQCLPLPSLLLGLQGEILPTLHPQIWPFSHLCLLLDFHYYMEKHDQ